MFAMTFGNATVNETRIQRSLAQFVRSIQSFDSKYDTGRAAAGNDGANFLNFTAAENAGKQLFLAPPPQGGAGCAGCHRPPEFDIDPASLNNGVTGKIGGGTDLTNTRSPSLRDLIGPVGRSNGGLMHDASFATLAQVINHYNQIPAINANLDNRLRRLRRLNGQVQNLNLTQAQKDALAAFLATLSGNAVYTDAKWSDPFNDLGELTLIVLPADQVSITDQGDGTAIISCQAAAGMNYLLQQSDDLKTWTNVTTVIANAGGVCSYSVGFSGSAAYYRYAFETPAP
jgi:cytochrome c peroxidase